METPDNIIITNHDSHNKTQFTDYLHEIIKGDNSVERQMASTTNTSQLYTCTQCQSNKFDYCQYKTSNVYYTDTKGTCNDSSLLGSNFYCSDKYSQTSMNYEFLTFLPCPYYTSKCGSSTQILQITTEQKEIKASGMELGDVCMYEINYNQNETNSNLKIWIDSLSNAEVTVVDGLEKHPYLATGKMNFYQQALAEGDSFEVGDSWNNLSTSTGGKCYIFIKAKASGAYCYFYYGEKNLLPTWALIVIIVGSILVALVCLFICCCYVRRIYHRRQAQSKVKRFNEQTESTDQKLNRYRYKTGNNGQQQTLPNYMLAEEVSSFQPMDLDKYGAGDQIKKKKKGKKNDYMQENQDFDHINYPLEGSTQSGNNYSQHLHLPGQLQN